MGTVAFDIAKSCGWAAINGEYIASGTLDFKDGVPKRGRHPGLVLLNARKMMTSVIARYQPTVVVFERPFVRGSGTRILWSLCGICELVAAEHGAATAEMGASEVRKILTGSGKSDKADVEAFLRTHGFDPDTSDESDAVAVLLAWELLQLRAAQANAKRAA